MRPLVDKRVLIVGAGGLGCPASLALARAGVGAITLVDPDVVDVTNLHRQLWHRDADIGRKKAESAAMRLARAFPEIEVRVLPITVDGGNAEALFHAHHVVVDATDSVPAKFLLSDVAVQTGVPLVYGGVLRMEGQVMEIAAGGPCLRCLFETPPDAQAVPTCAQAGVLGSVAGVVGAMQARIAVGRLRNPRATLQGVSIMRRFDGVALRTRQVRVRRAADCQGCGDRATSSHHGAAAP